MHVIEELLALDGSAAYLSSLGISECVSPARPSSSASSSSSSAAVSSAYLGAGGCGIGPSSSSSSAEAAELRSQLAVLTRRESALHAECDMLRKQAGRRSTEVRKLCERHAAEVSGLELQASAAGMASMEESACAACGDADAPSAVTVTDASSELAPTEVAIWEVSTLRVLATAATGTLGGVSEVAEEVLSCREASKLVEVCSRRRPDAASTTR